MDRLDDVAVIVATFGDRAYHETAQRVALPSAIQSGAAEIIPCHGLNLADARNAGAREATAEWLCFLDADDELEPGYFAAMAAASGDLRAPAVRFVVAGAPEPEPVSLEARNIDRINPCVIGTLLRRTLFDEAGAFWNERAWEDWSLFRRCWLLGAKIEHVAAAVYRVNVNPAGRNSTVDRPRELHREIRVAHRRWLRDRKDPR